MDLEEVLVALIAMGGLGLIGFAPLAAVWLVVRRTGSGLAGARPAGHAP